MQPRPLARRRVFGPALLALLTLAQPLAAQQVGGPVVQPQRPPSRPAAMEAPTDAPDATPAATAVPSTPLAAAEPASPETAPASVALPSAAISTAEELAARIDAPSPKVDAAQSTYVAEGGGLLPELLAAIASERASLQDRAAALDLREAEIAFAAAALSEQSRQLGQLKSEIERLLALADGNHHEDVTRLVRIYRAMKPAEAAAILSTADLELSVLVLAAMTERDAGPIFARMNQVRAQAVSKIILERSRLPGDQRLISLKVN